MFKSRGLAVVGERARTCDAVAPGQRPRESVVVQRRRGRPPLPPARRSATSARGLPDALLRGVERLSGLAMDDVRVHHDSCEPARLNALAFTRGTDIHVAPGEARQLAHEAWHVVQQKQGRVAGSGVVTDAALEREADVMGGRAANLGAGPVGDVPAPTTVHPQPDATAIQRKPKPIKWILKRLGLSSGSGGGAPAPAPADPELDAFVRAYEGARYYHIRTPAWTRCSTTRSTARAR